jgi:hypothetical protein
MMILMSFIICSIFSIVQPLTPTFVCFYLLWSDLGFVGGKSKSLYGRDGHLGITLVKFGGDQSGLKEATRMAEYFEKDNHGRKAWGCLQPVTLGKDDEKNPSLVKVDRSGEKTRILYGYLATAADLYKVDFETRKKVVIESLREYEASK